MSYRFITAISFLLLLPLAAGAEEFFNLTLAELLPEAPSRDSKVCTMCDIDIPNLSLEYLDSENVDTVAGRISNWNLNLINRTDSLYLAGFFGEVNSKRAAGEAKRYFKYHSLSSIDFITYLSAQTEVVWETNEKEIDNYFKGFANPGIYPVWGLKRARMGGGAFCMEFTIQQSFDAERMLGLRPVHLRATKFDPPPEKGRMAWDLEMPTLENGQANYLFCNKYSSRVRKFITEDNGVALEVLILDDIEGFYVKKRGVHRCTAMIFWRNLLTPDQWPPENPCLGAAAYFPNLTFKLPSFIPDIGLNDLRQFTAFQPLINAADCRSGSVPAWLALNSEGVIENWSNEGDIPGIIREWYPDN